jgi:hypothetical protein
VREQSFTRGRDAVLAPARHAHAQIADGDTQVRDLRFSRKPFRKLLIAPAATAPRRPFAAALVVRRIRGIGQPAARCRASPARLAAARRARCLLGNRACNRSLTTIP